MTWCGDTQAEESESRAPGVGADGLTALLVGVSRSCVEAARGYSEAGCPVTSAAVVAYGHLVLLFLRRPDVHARLPFPRTGYEAIEQTKAIFTSITLNFNDALVLAQV